MTMERRPTVVAVNIRRLIIAASIYQTGGEHDPSPDFMEMF